MNRKNPLAIPYFDNLPDRATPALQSAFDKVQEGYFGTAAIYRFFCNDMSQLGIDPPLQPIMTQWIEKVRKGDVFRPGGERKATKRPVFVAEAGATLSDVVDTLPPDTMIEFQKTDAEAVGAVPMAETETEASVLNDCEQDLEDANCKSIVLDPGDPSQWRKKNHHLAEAVAPVGLPSPNEDERISLIKVTAQRMARQQAEAAIEDITDELIGNARRTAQELVVCVLRDLAAELERGAA